MNQIQADDIKPGFCVRDADSIAQYLVVQVADKTGKKDLRFRFVGLGGLGKTHAFFVSEKTFSREAVVKLFNKLQLVPTSNLL